MITRIDHVHVVATDMDKSIAFYTDILGFRLVRRVQSGPQDARRELAYVGLGDVLLELLSPSQVAQIAGLATKPFALTVNDMAATLEELVSKGVEIVTPQRKGSFFEGLMAEIKDPSGLTIELREWHNDGPDNLDWQPERADMVRTA